VVVRKRNIDGVSCKDFTPPEHYFVTSISRPFAGDFHILTDYRQVIVSNGDVSNTLVGGTLHKSIRVQML